MASVEKVIDSRLANALMPDASVSPEALAAVGQLTADATVVAQGKLYTAPFISGLLPKIMKRELGWFKKVQGGLWVGGKATLSQERLTFAANIMNKALHSSADQLNWSLSLAEITGVEVRRAIITDIIDVHSRSGTRSIRCFRARAFAAEIAHARLATREAASHHC